MSDHKLFVFVVVAFFFYKEYIYIYYFLIEPNLYWTSNVPLILMFLSKNGCDIGLICGRFHFDLLLRIIQNFTLLNNRCLVETYLYRYSPYVIIEKMEREVKDRIRRSVACVGVLTRAHITACVFLRLNANTLLCSLNISHLSSLERVLWHGP